MNKDKLKISLESIDLVEPPGSLDDKVSRLIAAAEIQRSMIRRGVPSWAVASACTVSLVMGFMGGNRLTSESSRNRTEIPAVVIEIKPEELPPSFFVAKRRDQTLFFERQLHDVKIEIQKGKEGT